ncbi:MAG: MarR family transcriptional regulator [Clostridiales bacterium]|nr:MarR family transcriptional regulator [Clostridiales bacterium]
MLKYASLIAKIREFNRFYTNILGLLNDHLLESEFSLSEVRVLYEIGHLKDCTSKKLIEELRMDSGYLSRIIKRFEKGEFIYKVRSKEDGRLYYLYLTDRGKELLSILDELSDKQISQMVSKLSEYDKKRLVDGIDAIKGALSAEDESIRERITYRSELRPGDVGQLIQLHGWVYAQECGYNHVFEGYVCKTFYDMLINYSPMKERFWFVEVDGKMMGAIAVVGHTDKRAQMRWFVLDPAIRGMGIGSKLMNEALKYCREKGYTNVFLATTEDQKKAINMYLKAGFTKVEEYENHEWGKDLVEQIYELDLSEEQ